MQVKVAFSQPTHTTVRNIFMNPEMFRVHPRYQSAQPLRRA